MALNTWARLNPSLTSSGVPESSFPDRSSEIICWETGSVNTCEQFIEKGPLVPHKKNQHGDKGRSSGFGASDPCLHSQLCHSPQRWKYHAMSIHSFIHSFNKCSLSTQLISVVNMLVIHQRTKVHCMLEWCYQNGNPSSLVYDNSKVKLKDEKKITVEDSCPCSGR
jgi:hypothetical protein